ncbi:MAG: BamA/TamA family outer membrane protein, partial [Pseudomonadota bacterium]
ADLGAGANIGNRTQVRAGAFRGLGEFEASSNSSDLLPDGDFDTGAAYLSLRYDSLDDPFFATQGLLLYGDYQWHRDSLGSDFDFDRFEFMGQGAISFGEDKANNLVFTARATVLDDAPRAPQYFSRLGGLFNLSGISQDLLAGRQLAFLMAQYQRKLTRSGVLPIDVPVYAGFSVEGGNLWQDRSDMDLGDLVMAGSIYLAVNSPLGPVYIAYGRNEEELDAIYLSIGWPFLQPSGRLIR